MTALRVADFGSADHGRDRVVDDLLFDAVELELVLIDEEALPRCGRVKGGVYILDEVDRPERLLDLPGCRAPRCLVWSLDFGEERGENRGAGRNLDNAQDGAFGQRQRRQFGPHGYCQIVARA